MEKEKGPRGFQDGSGKKKENHPEGGREVFF